MTQIIVKIVITVALVIVISEVARRSTLVGGLIASLPVTSILAISWLYYEQRDVARVAQLSTTIVWLVVPSLVLFIVFPLLLKRNVAFALSLVLASVATIMAYGVMVMGLTRLGVKL